MPDFEKNIISMLLLSDNRHEFDVNNERCVMTISKYKSH
jgi:hypothetical protein